jgi:hypothetical protein
VKPVAKAVKPAAEKHATQMSAVARHPRAPTEELPMIAPPAEEAKAAPSRLTVEDMLSRIDALERAAAARGLRFADAPPATADQIERRETGLDPHFGELRWKLPPSYRALLGRANRLTCLDEDDRGIQIVSDEEMVGLNQDLVHMPEGVSRDEGVFLTTNHLVGFAATRYEAVWCFDVSAPDADGEYPVYYHHQDEPRARILTTGEWELPEDAAPDFRTFADWLAALADALLADGKPDWWERLGQPYLRLG